MLGRPTFRDLTDSYEAWTYRKGLFRQMRTLEQSQLVEGTFRGNDRLYRLTEPGRLHALGGRDPAVQWSRPWDGHWRLVLFDVPQMRHNHRNRLRRFLRQRSFGLLQRSVWITPDSLQQIQHYLRGDDVNVNSLVLLDARPSGGETDAQIVLGAWDFAAINQSYLEHIALLETMPRAALKESGAARDLRKWAAAERESWLNAVSKDPLLPEALLPDGYIGRKAWRRRVQVLTDAGDRLKTFRH